MIQLDIGQLVALMGIPSAITGLCFWMIQRQLSKRDAELDRRDAARERNEVLLVRSVGAAIALGEATATALKNGHANGETEAALQYAQKIKHEQFQSTRPVWGATSSCRGHSSSAGLKPLPQSRPELSGCSGSR